MISYRYQIRKGVHKMTKFEKGKKYIYEQKRDGYAAGSGYTKEIVEIEVVKRTEKTISFKILKTTTHITEDLNKTITRKIKNNYQGTENILLSDGYISITAA